MIDQDRVEHHAILRTQHRNRCFGVVLTGMGSDGAAGLAAIRKEKGSTYVQGLESCTVPGMPGAALRKGLADKIATPAELGRLLVRDA